MKKEFIKSGCTMLGSLAGWKLTRNKPDARIPSMLIGGFLGSIMGEVISKKQKNKKPEYLYKKGSG